MAGDLIVVFGGSGFLGRYVVRELAKRGKRIRVPMRRPHLGQDLRLLGGVGQIQLVQANVRFPDSVDAALEGADGVVNLVGLLCEKNKQTFFNVQAEGAATVAAKADTREIERFVHVSAIGAGPKSPSRYGRTKFDAEEAVRTSLPAAVIVRPSIIFGPEDDFFNRFADMARFMPALPLLGFGKTKFQPVYVGDVAEAIANALDDKTARGRIFELGGPRVYSFKELLKYILKTIDRQNLLIPLPLLIAQPMGSLIDALFKLHPFADPPLTGDQVGMLRKDNVVRAEAGVGVIADLGVRNLESVESIAPTYLWRFRPHGQFQARPAA
ncbi:MAG TPA: complex I NDUFA9 subunit family protein [Caulobacterales bacterium]|nr:complex I NDUFA9 subunit family protein [Caulobacterales bacterium]